MFNININYRILIHNYFVEQVHGFVEDVNGKKQATLFGKWDDSMYYINGITNVKTKDMSNANSL